MISISQQRMRYILGDLLSSVVAWTSFNVARYYVGGRALYEFASLSSFMTSKMVLLGEIVFPLLMLAVYWLSGFYNEVFRKSHVQDFITTFFSSLTNTIIIFFIALINDVILDHRGTNYELLLILLSILFVFTFVVRFWITKTSNSKFETGEWKYNAIVIGANKSALNLGHQLSEKDTYLSYNIVGYVPVEGETCTDNDVQLYKLDELDAVCSQYDVKELIVVPSNNQVASLLDIVKSLYRLGLPIKVSPDIYTILVGRMRLSNLRGEPLVDISSCGMTEFEKNVKRLADIVSSFIALILLSPLLLIIAIWVKIDSKGDVIYKQERVGYHCKKFTIYKFRSMVTNAEADGCPALSSENDNRITKLGQILRKYRIDELPQFWNVLVGDMSLVGPRPERQYFVDQIIKEAPLYSLLFQVRPGITSMGMVKYGYAKNVQEMIDRFRYDLLYLENMSIVNDIKILIYTIKIVITGKGI